jgi:predicted DNA-binding protein
MNKKAMSLRLPEEKAAELAAVARTDEMTISDAVREAIAKHIASRRTDPEFKKRVREQIEEDRKTLESLAGEEASPKGN